MVLKFIKSLAISFIIFVLYISFFYTSKNEEPKQNMEQKIEMELAEYQAKLEALSEKEQDYNNLMQKIKQLREVKNKKISELLSSIELKNVLKTLSTNIKSHSLSVSAFNVDPKLRKFFDEYKFNVKFRGNYNNIVALMADQDFLPTNAKVKSLSIEGPVSDSKYIVTETELNFSLFKEHGGNS